MNKNYITRKISKLAGKTIIPPTPEEILTDDFNYPDYVQRMLNLKVDKILLENFFEEDEKEITLVDPNISAAFNDFENEIIEIQKQYEEDLKNKCQSLDYNAAMKEIASAYFERLKAIESFNHQRKK